jgi:HEAT repeat protein
VSSGNEEGAARLNAKLDDMMRNAAGSRERAAAIAALGNARRAGDIEKLSSIAAEEQDPDVREAAVRALGRQGAETEARDALAGLLKSEQMDASTGAVVIRGLSRTGALRDDDMDAIASFASDRDLDSDLAGEMSRALSLQYRERTGESWREAMGVVAAKAQGAPAIQAQGMLMLDSLRSDE